MYIPVSNSQTDYLTIYALLQPHTRQRKSLKNHLHHLYALDTKGKELLEKQIAALKKEPKVAQY